MSEALPVKQKQQNVRHHLSRPGYHDLTAVTCVRNWWWLGRGLGSAARQNLSPESLVPGLLVCLLDLLLASSFDNETPSDINRISCDKTPGSRRCLCLTCDQALLFPLVREGPEFVGKLGKCCRSIIPRGSRGKAGPDCRLPCVLMASAWPTPGWLMGTSANFLPCVQRQQFLQGAHYLSFENYT